MCKEVVRLLINHFLNLIARLPQLFTHAVFAHQVPRPNQDQFCFLGLEIRFNIGQSSMVAINKQ